VLSRLVASESYTDYMDQKEAIEKARRFAQTAYATASNDILRERKDDLAKMHNQLAARGMALSGALVIETARLTGERIRALMQARLDSVLEGYDLYGIVIDDEMATGICFDIMGEATRMTASAAKGHAFPAGMPSSAAAAYPHALEQHVGLSAAWVRTQIDRRRLMPKKNERPSITTIYNVQGDNARWNINSKDQSVNVVNKSNDEFFTALRRQIELEIADANERRLMLETLSALQESHGKPSFAHRYTDFMAAAANHITVIVPFIPALTEMLHKVLS